MANRTSVIRLAAIVSRINTITKSPQEPYVMVDGKPIPQAGCFLLSSAYGGYSLHRMTEGGGETDIFQVGHVKANELASLMYAFIRGLEIAGL